MAVYVHTLGVNNYRHPIASLRCCERDAHDVAALLAEGFGFKAEYLEERKTDDVVDRIEALEPLLKPGDSYVFFFSGHGKASADDQYLLLPGATLHTLEMAQGEAPGLLSFNALKRRTSRPAWKGVQRLFILDACRSALQVDKAGELAVCDAQFLLRDIRLRRRDNKVDDDALVTVLNSCELGAVAAELPERGNGLFTAALLNVLRAGKSSRQVRIDAALVQSVGEQMRVDAQTAGLPPTLLHQPALRGPELQLAPEILAQPTHTAPPAQPVPAADEVEWMLVQTQPSQARLEAFVRSFPGSRHVAEALDMLKALAKKAEPPPPAPKVPPTVPVDVVVTPLPPAPSPRPTVHPRPAALPESSTASKRPNSGNKTSWAFTAIAAVLGVSVWGLWQTNKQPAPVTVNAPAQPNTPAIDAAETERVLAIWRRGANSAAEVATLPVLQRLANQGHAEAMFLQG
jgi:hypothetical protein